MKMILTLLLAISSLGVHADPQPKVGFFNVDEFLTTTDIVGQDFKQRAIDSWNQENAEELRTLENEIRTLEKQNAATVMDAQTRQRLTTTLKEKKSELVQFQNGASVAIEAMQETMMKVLRSGIERQAKSMGFSIIYEYESADSRIVLYVKPALDITADVAAAILKAKAEKKAMEWVETQE